MFNFNASYSKINKLGQNYNRTMICKPYWEQIPCSQVCASKISSHPTTSRLEEHIWLDDLSLRLYMPTEPNQWLPEMWLWQKNTAWRQDTKELHNPTLFITSATDRQSDRCGWNHCLLKTKKAGTAQTHLALILLQRYWQYVFVCLPFLPVILCLVYGLWERSDKLIHYPFAEVGSNELHLLFLGN